MLVALVRARRPRHGDRLRESTLSAYIEQATEVSPAHPVLVDLPRWSVEIDVDALYDGTDLYLGGVMEHIEEAGIAPRLACALPPITLGAEVVVDHHSSTGRSPAASGCVV